MEEIVPEQTPAEIRQAPGSSVPGGLKLGTVTRKKSEAEFDREFKPRGAMVFFLLLILLSLVIWFAIYFLMLERV